MYIICDNNYGEERHDGLNMRLKFALAEELKGIVYMHSIQKT